METPNEQAAAGAPAAETKTDVTQMPAAIIGGDQVASPTAEELAAKATEDAAKAAEAGEKKYDADGFELNEDGTQKLGEDGKPIPKPVEGKAPAEYADFTPVEGTIVDEPTMAEFKTMAKDLDLTQEQAQQLFDFGGNKIKALAEAPYKAWSDLQLKWQGEVQADPEIGGTNLEATVANAARVYQPGPDNPFVKNADEAEALKAALNTTGSGNHPAVVRLFARLGALLGEPASLSGKENTEANTKPGEGASIYDQMYPTMPVKGSTEA
jgi:hypothetical protein